MVYYVIFLQECEHSHPDDHDVIIGKMEEKIQENPSKPVKRVYNRVVMGANDVSDEDIPDFHHLRSRLQRTRASFMPLIPHDVDDVIMGGDWLLTWSNHRFMCHQDNDWGLLMFATKSNFRKLQRCATVYIDGTFKTCPAPYVQFVSVHGMVHDRVIPLVFAMTLMTGKQVGQYREMLKVIKRKIRNTTGIVFQPERVVCDFELSLISALQTELPRTAIAGCYFHFCQSLWRRVQELGLTRHYRSNWRLRKLVRKLFALGYLPLPLVRQNFNGLMQENRTRRMIRRYLHSRTSLVIWREIISTQMETSHHECGTFSSETQTHEQTTMLKVTRIRLYYSVPKIRDEAFCTPLPSAHLLVMSVKNI